MANVKSDEKDSRLLSNIEDIELRKTPYPKRTFFIIVEKFCERFCFHCMSTVLALYLNFKLGYTEKGATILYHAFNMGTFFSSIFGGILSDVWLGKFKTILYFTIIYWIGSTIVAISSIPILNIPANVTLIIGLVLIAIGNGPIKACMPALGGDQFKLPEQAANAATFFSMYFFGFSSGSLIANSIAPILRKDFHCFGDEDCFPLAFGVSAIMMFAGLVSFLAGRSSYTYIEPSSENMLVQVFKCVTNAISTKIREGRKIPSKNLLDYSIDKYGQQLVNDTRALSRILVLYLPLPMFWALYDQQFSRWTFQANKMSGDIGFYFIKPDQMQSLSPMLALAFIMLFETVIYPILHRIGIGRPLHKMTLGLCFASVAFLLSAIVQFRIEKAPEKSLSMLWLLPQYVALSAGEVMFSITGMSFSYAEAPERMKSVVLALWLLTVGIGNLILLSITKMAFFESQAHEFLLFSGLMFVCMLIFSFLAYNFKSGNRTDMDPKHLEQCIPLNKIEENASL